jgi:hypothetical protein
MNGLCQIKSSIFLSVINEGNQVTKSNLRDSDIIVLPMDRMHILYHIKLSSTDEPPVFDCGDGDVRIYMDNSLHTKKF